MLGRKDYENGILEDECDLLKELEDYEGDYVCDGITELSDSFVPISTNEIWEYTKDIREDIEDAMTQGLAEGVKDLTKLFQIGYFYHYEEHCYKYLEDVAYNICVSVYNKEYQIGECPDDEVSAIIEVLAKEFDHNDSWDDLREKFREKIEAL